MLDLDFSDQIRAKLYPIEESDDSILAAERFGGKKRSKLKDSDFLDSKRRSFPVMSCKDVKDAVSTWGMYKGPMSFDTFKSKLKSRAKKLGCDGALPKSWGDESKSGMKGGKSNYDNVDKEELREDTKKEKKQHYKDAIKDDKKQIKDLKKDEKVDKKKEAGATSDKQKAAKEKFLEMIRKKKGGDKKDDEKGDKKKESDAKSKKQWEKIDKKELDRDTKKEKEEHEKDAIKDDQKKIDKLKKGKPSVKKSVEKHDLKKDQEFDEEDKIKDKDKK
jgi:hypothetical protein